MSDAASLYALFQAKYAQNLAKDAKNLAVDIHQEANQAQLNVSNVRTDIERLYLLVEALWTILKTSTGLTDEDFVKIVEQLDLQDGKLDGSNATHTVITQCPNCGKTLLKGHRRCAYCQADVFANAPFRHIGK